MRKRVEEEKKMMTFNFFLFRGGKLADKNDHLNCANKSILFKILEHRKNASKNAINFPLFSEFES